MKTEASEILNSRTAEIREFSKFLIQLEQGTSKAGASTVLSTAKATFAIQNYSLAEAVVVSILNELSKTIESDCHHFAELTTEVQKFWVTERARMMRASVEKTLSEAMWEAILAGSSANGLKAIPEQELRKAFLGNVDARAIRALFDRLALKTNFRAAARDGNKLRRVKEDRNNLAHGIYSFSEVGRNYTAVELREVSIRIRCYLMDLIRSFERYMKNYEYLSPGTRNATTSNAPSTS